MVPITSRLSRDYKKKVPKLSIKYRVRTLFQKQISRTFPGLSQDSDWFFQDSKIQFNPFTPTITVLLHFSYCLLYFSLFIFLTVCYLLSRIFYLSLTDFQNFPGPEALFQDFQVLESAIIIKFQDFPGFPGPIQTLFIELTGAQSLPDTWSFILDKY